jgi:O-acetyl-ADP-ribose deacetylase
VTAITARTGDITAEEVDAVVNAANEHLQHGGGVALAIARAGGPVLQEASDRWVAEHGPLRPGVAAVTPAGAMPAEVVVHVAGPRYREGQDNAGLLGAAVVAALDAAAAEGCRTVALPAISAGIFGYPLAEATRVIVSAARDWVAEHPDALDEIRLVGFDEGTTAAFREALSPPSREASATEDR